MRKRKRYGSKQSASSCLPISKLKTPSLQRPDRLHFGIPQWLGPAQTRSAPRFFRCLCLGYTRTSYRAFNTTLVPEAFLGESHQKTSTYSPVSLCIQRHFHRRRPKMSFTAPHGSVGGCHRGNVTWRSRGGSGDYARFRDLNFFRLASARKLGRAQYKLVGHGGCATGVARGGSANTCVG